MEVIFQKVTGRNERRFEPSFPGTASGECLYALVNPEEDLKQPYRNAAKRWIAATLLLTKLETI